MRRSPIVVLLVALLAALAVAGSAATLGVTSKKVDTFAANLSASTSVGNAPPAFSKAEYFDVITVDGKIDRIIVTYNEALGAFTGSASNWTLTNAPTGMSVSPLTVNIAGSTVELDWTTLSTAANTGVSNLQLSLNNSSGGVKDAAGAPAASFSLQPVDDKAGPVPVSVLVGNKSAGNDGRPEVDDLVTVVFSEQLDRQTICANTSDTDWTNAAAGVLDNNSQVTATFTETGTDTLSASSAACSGGMSFGSVSFDNEGYITTLTNFVGSSPNQSEVRWTPSTSTLQLILGTPDQTTVDINASSVTATYTPGIAMKDLSNNAAAGSASRQARQF